MLFRLALLVAVDRSLKIRWCQMVCAGGVVKGESGERSSQLDDINMN
jgi:hypothetical protein